MKRLTWTMLAVGVAIILMAALLLACERPGTPVAAEGALDDFKLVRLFSHDGCTVYRFTDGGSFRYFSDCRGRVSTTVTCGKNCYRSEEVETVK